MNIEQYKKLALKFACKFCNGLTAGEIKRAKDSDLLLNTLIMRAYSYGCYNCSDDFNSGEKAYISKVAKGVKLGGLDGVLWIK